MFVCDLCPAQKPNRRMIYKHMMEKHVKREYPCPVCGKILRSYDLKFKHMLHHDASKRRFFCELCPQHQGFILKTDYQRHVLAIHKLEPPAKPYSCKMCGRGYGSVATLNYHRKKVHGLENPD
jgi:hypothetical protein